MSNIESCIKTLTADLNPSQREGAERVLEMVYRGSCAGFRGVIAAAMLKHVMKCIAGGVPTTLALEDGALLFNMSQSSASKIYYSFLKSQCARHLFG